MKVLVTGGAGYIGSVVTEELLASGHRVVVYDNLSKGHRDAVTPPAEFVHADLLDVTTLMATLRDRQIEAVIHLAADSLVGESVVNPAKYYRNNVQAGLGLLESLRQSEIRVLVFSSTAAVYGEPDTQPIDEEAPTVPTNPYGETKLTFERALRWYDRAYGLRYASLRYFNAAGATVRNGERHDPETHLIPLVLQAAVGIRSEVAIFGDDYPTKDGTCLRDYIHVADLARAHVLALEALAEGRLESRIYNLGSEQGYSVREVIEAAGRVCRRPIPVRVVARRAGDPATLIASSARIHRELRWQPTHGDLATIVESAWRWMEHRAARGATLVH